MDGTSHVYLMIRLVILEEKERERESEREREREKQRATHRVRVREEGWGPGRMGGREGEGGRKGERRRGRIGGGERRVRVSVREISSPGHE